MTAPPPTDHALVVGGTGMLRAVSLDLARRHHTVSVVARSHARLSVLSRHGAGRINPIAVDWHDTQRFAMGLRAAITAHGPISLAVCWIHRDAHPALQSVADIIADHRAPPRLFEIVGSESHNPAGLPRTIDLNPGEVLYRRVALGFVLEHASSRWLTDDEIARGVLDAIAADRSDSIIGVVEPWDRRP